MGLALIAREDGHYALPRSLRTTQSGPGPPTHDVSQLVTKSAMPRSSAFSSFNFARTVTRCSLAKSRASMQERSRSSRGGGRGHAPGPPPDSGHGRRRCSRNRHLTAGPWNLLFWARPMSIGRTILALLVALSVAFLPAAGGAGVSAKSPESADMSAMTDMHECCPPQDNPCDKAMDDCGTMAGCALKCSSFAATAFSIIAFPSAPAAMTASFVGHSLSSQMGNPPFRPPRV
jgi:hypothetical protein